MKTIGTASLKTNPLMRKIAVMVSCIDDDLDVSRQYYKIVEEKRQIKVIIIIPKILHKFHYEKYPELVSSQR